ncbi:MAG TPA: class I SAM-dependent methyltransferase [Flavobacteriaceae bacterium]|nr:class I SAM-dependent methyltransferase [Flavobacteriaceae bacterium]HEX5743078.1 class I SAM-dependent methyltransferase [Flavobacteriaceae bacterium]
MSEIDYKSHWEKVYEKRTFDKLGWYEKQSVPSLELIKQCNISKDAKILNVGAGATTIIDDLLKLGYNNLIANDISAPALEVLKSRLNEDDLNKVQFIIDDLTNPTILSKFNNIDVWHDRAVLHFFTVEKDQDTYFNLLKTVLKPGGFAILAEFNLEGALKCSGLDVYRYNAAMLQNKLGMNFKLLKTFDYIYTMPSGEERSYVYTLFQNNNNE